MGSSKRRAYAFTVCIRDDDAKTYEFRVTGDSTGIADAVAAAVARGRKVRCYTLAADAQAREREEKYLAGKGYRQTGVLL